MLQQRFSDVVWKLDTQYFLLYSKYNLLLKLSLPNGKYTGHENTETMSESETTSASNWKVIPERRCYDVFLVFWHRYNVHMSAIVIWKLQSTIWNSITQYNFIIDHPVHLPDLLSPREASSILNFFLMKNKMSITKWIKNFLIK